MYYCKCYLFIINLSQILLINPPIIPTLIGSLQLFISMTSCVDGASFCVCVCYLAGCWWVMSVFAWLWIRCWCVLVEYFKYFCSVGADVEWGRTSVYMCVYEDCGCLWLYALFPSYFLESLIYSHSLRHLNAQESFFWNRSWFSWTDDPHFNLSTFRKYLIVIFLIKVVIAKMWF